MEDPWLRQLLQRWGGDHDDAHPTAFAMGLPAVVDAPYDHGVARSESVRAVVEDDIDASVEDDVEIQAVGVMDLCCHARRELDEGP